MSDPGEPPGPLDLSPGDGGERGPLISVTEGQTVGGPPPRPIHAPRTKVGPASVTGRSKSRPRRASAESCSSDEGESNGGKAGGAGEKPGPSGAEHPQVDLAGEAASLEEYIEGGPFLQRRRLDFTAARPKDRIPGNPVEIADVLEIGKYSTCALGKPSGMS